ncbi:MAG TPA: flagellar export protein FliJ [Pseudomonadales bacterium]
MKRSERLEKINAINNGFKSLAGANLARIEQECKAAQHQLDQLRIYKDEYADQLKGRMDSGHVTPEEIQDFRYFFASLHKAISQQESVVRHMQKQLEDARQEWLAKDQEVRKIDRIGENMRREEAQAEARREQKRSDEMSMLAHGRLAFSMKH